MAKTGATRAILKQQVEIYRSNREAEILPSPQALSGEDVLPGFVLDLVEIW